MKKSAVRHASTATDIDHQRLVSLINSMGDAVVAVDRNLNIVTYNGAALNILDRNILTSGTPLRGALNLINKRNQQVNLDRLIKTASKAISNRDYRIVYKDKSTANVYLSIAPVRLGYGKDADQGFVLLLRDITHEKSLEEERNEFISVVSHELRTPLAIAEGNISNAQFIVKKNHGGKTVEEALRQTYEQIRFLADMINDLSTLSRAERGKLTLNVERINVVELLHDLQQNYQPDAKQKGLVLHLETDPSLELLNSDRLYVREVLQNFITNAIKYTEKGSITISAKPGMSGITFSVRDTGLGISKADRERVFEKFFRSEDYRMKQTKGTGLGLYVTMKLARLLRASIELDSELNKGSEFRITIPDLT